MECPKCGASMNFRPGGISKKGTAYTPFYSCHSCGQTIDAGNTVPVSPVTPLAGVSIPHKPISQSVPNGAPDWDAIAVGKVASNFIQAKIASGTHPAAIDLDDLTAAFDLAKKVVYWGRD